MDAPSVVWPLSLSPVSGITYLWPYWFEPPAVGVFSLLQLLISGLLPYPCLVSQFTAQSGFCLPGWLPWIDSFSEIKRESGVIIWCVSHFKGIWAFYLSFSSTLALSVTLLSIWARWVTGLVLIWPSCIFYPLLRTKSVDSSLKSTPPMLECLLCCPHRLDTLHETLTNSQGLPFHLEIILL